MGSIETIFTLFRGSFEEMWSFSVGRKDHGIVHEVGAHKRGLLLNTDLTFIAKIAVMGDGIVWYSRGGD